jgi:hypothetical protein
MMVAVAGPALAQPPEELPAGHPPLPPPQQQQEDVEELPAGHPPIGPLGAREQIADEQDRQEQEAREQRTDRALGSDEIHRILSGEELQIATAQPNDELPAGTIRVQVVDVEGQPVEGQRIDLGIMAQNNVRSEEHAEVDAAGVASFRDLSTGTSQAYRVNLSYRGAKYSSTPFQLPTNRGYDVRLLRIPTTRSERAILLLLHRTFLELKPDERVQVVHQLQVINLARDTYVMPADGKQFRLPEGFTAFQSQPVMTDQRFEQTDDGFRLHGSFPPGRTNLVYGYDIPLDGTSLDLTIPVPFRTYVVRVEANAPAGMEMDVAGMPRPEVHDTEGHRVMLVEVQRAPEDPPLERIEIRLRNIPGPGPWRWLAVGAALVLLFAAVMFATRRGGADRTVAAEARAARRDELLARAAEIEKMFEESEIGPKYKKRQMDAITDELASLLRDDERAG